MSIVSALSKLLVKMGGTPATGDNTDELVNKIATVYDPATQELPSVTASDVGKYLHVNDTTSALEWDDVSSSELPDVTSSDKNKYLHTNNSTGDLEWAEASGGASEFVVTITYNGSSYVSDKTFDEISTAYTNGEKLVVIDKTGPNDFIYSLVRKMSNSFTFGASFGNENGDYKNTAFVAAFVITKSGNRTVITSTSATIAGVPYGGTQGQALVKRSGTAYDVQWSSVADENDIFIVHLETGAVGGSYKVTNTTYDEIENAITVDKKYVVAILYRGQKLFTLYKYVNGVGIFLQSSEVKGSDNKVYSSEIIKIFKSNDGRTFCQKDTSNSQSFFVVERDDVYKTPYIIRLLCDGDPSYKDNPSGVLSLDCPLTVGTGKNEYYISSLYDLCYTWLRPNINYFYLGKFNGFCKICYGTADFGDTQKSEKVEYYDLVSIDSEPSVNPTHEEPDLKITATFRAISSRGNSIVIKTITLSDNYAISDPVSMNSLVPVYSEEVYEPGGGGSGLKVSCTTVNNKITADKTYEDIAEALANGINVIAVLDNRVYLLYYVYEHGSDSNIQFMCYTQETQAETQTLTKNVLFFKSDGSILNVITEGFRAFSSVGFVNEANTMGLMPAIRFGFQYSTADDSLSFIDFYGSSDELYYFFESGGAGNGDIVFLTVNVINGSGEYDHVDIYQCQKAWHEFAGDNGEEHIGHAIFSRSRVGVNPNKIYIDEVEIAYDMTAYNLKSSEARTAEVSASAISSIY